MSKILLILTLVIFGLSFGNTLAKAGMREIGTVVYEFSPLLSSIDTTGFDLMTLGVPFHANTRGPGLTVVGTYKGKEIHLTSENNRLYFLYANKTKMDLNWLETYNAYKVYSANRGANDSFQPLIFRAEKDGVRVMYIINKLSVDKVDDQILTDLFGVFLTDISP